MLLCKTNRSVYIEQNNLISSFTGKDSWTIMSPMEQNIRKKIQSCGVALSDWNLAINYGIKTGCNDAFIISSEKKDELIAADPKSAELIRPILRGRDVKRYGFSFADQWIIATFPSCKYDIDQYPAIKQYFLSFGIERLEQTGATHIIDGVPIKSRKKTNNKWFETQDSISYWNEFFKQKIIWGNLALSAQFAWAEEGYFINAPSSMIVPGNKYLLAVLNSKLADWYIRQLGVTRNGGYFEYKPMFIEQLPVPVLDEEVQIPYIRLVDKIIEEKRALNDTQHLESEINQRVYALYHLREEEILYIESQ